MENLYWQIKRALDENGMSQKELAEKLGISTSNLSIYLSRLKTKSVTTSKLEKILKILNLKIKLEEA